MPLPKVPLITSLALGGAAGVVALSALAAGPAPVNTSDTEQPRPVVTRAAPCPAGTVDTPTACVRRVTVHVPAAAPRSAPVTSTRVQEPVVTEQPRATQAPARATEHEDGQDQEQEHEDAEHDGTETESDG